MNTAELKMDLFRKIDALKGKDLKEVYGLLMNFINSNSEIDHWEELSDGQREALKEGLEQLNNGEGKSHKAIIADFRNRFLNA